MSKTIDLKEGVHYNVLPSAKTENTNFATLATDSVLWLVLGIARILFKILLFCLKAVFFTFLIKTLLLPVLAWFLKRIENWIDSFFSSVFRTLGFFAVLAAIIYFTLKHYNLL